MLNWLVIGAAVIIALWWMVRQLEEQLLYVPDRVYVQPKDVGLGDLVEERQLRTKDGHKVIAWYAQADAGRPTLLYFHGNAGSLASRSAIFQRYKDQGIGLFMMTYRGYGGSTGTPSESANVSDALMAYDTLRKLDVPANHIFLYGESLGTGIAVQIAGMRDVAGIILDAPYTAIVEVAQLHYPYLPSGLLMRDRYETKNFIGKVRQPVLVVHGELDFVVPVEMGRKIAASTAGPAEIKTFRNAGHSDHDQFGSVEAILEWLERTFDGASGPATDEQSKISDIARRSA